MTPWLKRQLIVPMGCVALNAAAAWPTVGYAERVEVARQTPAPAGQRYLDTCDGFLPTS